VRTRTLTYFRLPTVPAALLATFPLGVERRECCGGERGLVGFVGLNVCCPCVSFMSCTHPYMSGCSWIGRSSQCTYGTRVIYDSVFADEHNGSL